MRKGLFNKICTLTVAVATMLMGYSCQQEEFIYTPEGACVTFQNVPVTNFELDGEDLQIQIMRGKGDTEETVAISLASGSIYTLENSSVTFAKNEFSKTIALSYDDENFPLDENQQKAVTLIGEEFDYLRVGKDAVFFHECKRITHRIVGCKEERVGNNAVFAALYLVHLQSLLLNRHILMDDTDTAFSCHSNSKGTFCNSIHRRTHKRYI